MRKLRFLIFILLLMICIPSRVFASGNVSVSTSNLSIVKGEAKSFVVSANNAAGRIDISIANSSIASISGSSLFLDNQSGSIIVKGLSVGTTSIRVVVTDVTTYDDEDLSGKTYSINVTVTEPTSNNNTDNNITNNNTNNNATNNNNANNSTTNKVDNKSKNNDIKEISIDGYKLNKIDNTNYSLEVSNNITSVNVKATASDSKAKVTGIGSHDLKVGENKIEVIVTSESGAKKSYYIKVIRKDGYYLEDLDIVLNNKNNSDINIIVSQDSKISTDDLTKIKKSGKVVKLNYYDKNKLLIYSWTINGKEISDIGEFLTTITYVSEYAKDISKLSNYADGLYVSFKHSGALPKGTKIKLYVGDKFDDDSLVNIYYYNNYNKRLELVEKSISVKSGYVEFGIEHCSEYFVTMSNVVSNVKKVVSTKRSKLNVFLIISFVEFVIIIILLFIMDRKRKKKQTDINVVSTDNSKNMPANGNVNTTNNVVSNTNMNNGNIINK